MPWWTLAELERIGITLMDGPFFSCMPFPAEGCHSLSHVRYTPHGYFIDDDGCRDPVAELSVSHPQSKQLYMIAAAVRYLPCLRRARYLRSLFEVKTVLVHNGKADDGRPILLRRERMHPRFLSILGGKIDNIYDIFDRLNPLLEEWDPAGRDARANSGALP